MCRVNNLVAAVKLGFDEAKKVLLCTRMEKDSGLIQQKREELDTELQRRKEVIP